MYNDEYPKRFNSEENVKEYARFRLYQTDYAVLPDVNIKNKQAFINYRILIRAALLDPHTAWNFPKPPEPQWIKPGDMIDQSTEEPSVE
jgi:hypothetical protein